MSGAGLRARALAIVAIAPGMSAKEYEKRRLAPHAVGYLDSTQTISILSIKVASYEMIVRPTARSRVAETAT